jgi:hypothetical protein
MKRFAEGDELRRSGLAQLDDGAQEARDQFLAAEQ